MTSPIEIIDNYITASVGRDALDPPEDLPRPETTYVVTDVSFVWKMYGGRDFDSSPATKTSNKTQLALQNYRFTEISFATFTRIATYLKYLVIHVFRNRAIVAKKMRRRDLGGPQRDLSVCTQLHVNKLQLRYDIYPVSAAYASRILLLVKNVEICDCVVSSRIHKLLYLYESDSMPKLTNKPMVSGSLSQPD